MILLQHSEKHPPPRRLWCTPSQDPIPLPAPSLSGSPYKAACGGTALYTTGKRARETNLHETNSLNETNSSTEPVGELTTVGLNRVAS